MKQLIGALLCIVMLCACSNRRQVTADYNIVPIPAFSHSVADSTFVLTEASAIVCADSDSAMQRNAAFLAGYIKDMTGLQLEVTDQPRPGAITLSGGLVADNPEEYILNVKADGISLQGASPAAVFYGIQTLRKSIPAPGDHDVAFPYAQIIDSPRFAFRGAMLDVSRHFFSVDEVKRFIDMLALHNMNAFHWHLTDDQGWRLEIKSRPELTAKGSMRPETIVGYNSTGQYDGTPHGGFYTQDEAREIVQYAADRYITVIPEIDSPGHMLSALAGYPELGCLGGPYEVWNIFGVCSDVLCAGNDSTYHFLDDVLTEVCDIFPSENIHIGGDEVPKLRWENCDKCQAKIRELGLRDDAHSTAEQKLQRHVTAYVADFLAKRGRHIMGWDEILEGGLTPGSAIMTWRGSDGGVKALKAGHDVILTSHDYCYLDYFQSSDTIAEPIAWGHSVPVEKVYSYEPVPLGLTSQQKSLIKGIEACVWTAYIPDFDMVGYMTLPRLAAVAEVAWSKFGNKDMHRFAHAVGRLENIYELEGYNYATFLHDAKFRTFEDPTMPSTTVELFSYFGDPINYTRDRSEPTLRSLRYSKPIEFYRNDTIYARTMLPDSSGHVVKIPVTVPPLPEE